jgi:hypothetical protein
MKTTRYIGQCQICEGDQKLYNGQMVHHGYRRPGCGEIIGDCPGVGHAPYEASCECVKQYKADCELRLVGSRKYLSDLVEGRVTEITELRRRLDRSHEVIKYTPADPLWRVHLDAKISEMQYGIESTVRTIKHLETRIASWEPKPIRTVEEEQHKADAALAERKAVREAARAARAAKRAATKAKQEELEARRTAIRKDFETKFEALAASSEDPNICRMAALHLLRELNKTKYNWLARYELRCETAFVALGLARATGRVNGFGRPYIEWLV